MDHSTGHDAPATTANRTAAIDPTSDDTAPEELCYLVGSNDPAVRKAVAGNPRTPPQADRLLSDDPDGEVRSELAGKIGRLLADLRPDELQTLSAFTVATLEQLANDALPRVRSLLAEEIKALRTVPKPVIERLARDVEAIVAAPILEYSPLLSDDDLIEIVSAATVERIIAAVARRRNLSEEVADAVVATLEIPAIAALLANPSARIRETTMQRIAAHAMSAQMLHEPMVMRADLSARVMRRIAGFVNTELLEQLQSRSGLDDETRAYLRRRMQARLKEIAPKKTSSAAELARAEILKCWTNGCLDDGFVIQAARDGWRDAVEEALAVLAGIERTEATRILSTRNGWPVVALCWAAGLSMRTAYEIQLHILRLPPTDVIAARNGIDFPLIPRDMEMLLTTMGFSCSPQVL